MGNTHPGRKAQSAASKLDAVKLSKLLIEAPDLVVNHIGAECRTPLLTAANSHYTPINADRDPQRDAAQLRFIEILLDAGADVRLRDSRGRTSLHLVCLRNCSKAVVVALVQGGSDISAEDNFGTTPVMRAVKSKAADALEAFYEERAVLHDLVLVAKMMRLRGAVDSLRSTIASPIASVADSLCLNAAWKQRWLVLLDGHVLVSASQSGSIPETLIRLKKIKKKIVSVTTSSSPPANEKAALYSASSSSSMSSSRSSSPPPPKTPPPKNKMDVLPEYTLVVEDDLSRVNLQLRAKDANQFETLLNAFEAIGIVPNFRGRSERLQKIANPPLARLFDLDDLDDHDEDGDHGRAMIATAVALEETRHTEDQRPAAEEEEDPMAIVASLDYDGDGSLADPTLLPHNTPHPPLRDTFYAPPSAPPMT